MLFVQSKNCTGDKKLDVERHVNAPTWPPIFLLPSEIIEIASGSTAVRDPVAAVDANNIHQMRLMNQKAPLRNYYSDTMISLESVPKKKKPMGPVLGRIRFEACQ
jgi:hypothetical protein